MAKIITPLSHINILVVNIITRSIPIENIVGFCTILYFLAYSFYTIIISFNCKKYEPVNCLESDKFEAMNKFH